MRTLSKRSQDVKQNRETGLQRTTIVEPTITLCRRRLTRSTGRKVPRGKIGIMMICDWLDPSPSYFIGKKLS